MQGRGVEPDLTGTQPMDGVPHKTLVRRLWVPDGTPPMDSTGLHLIGGMSSEQWLYLLMEAPPQPPPTYSKEEDATRHVPMLVLRVFTESGDELAMHSGGTLWKFHMSDELGPLTVRLHDEGGSVIWETVITAITPE